MPILNLRLSMSFNVKSERKQMETREKFRAILVSNVNYL